MLGFSAVLQVPAGDKITVNTDGSLNVPDNPIIPFIGGDGTGPDIWRTSVRVFDAAVQKTSGIRRKVSWFEIFAGAKALSAYGDDCPPNLLPDETVEAIKEYNVAIKAPLTTPVGKGIRSLNVALRLKLDLYVCLRPVRYFDGASSPVKRTELVDMVIFRENIEDLYAGIEWEEGSTGVKKVMDFFK